MRQPPPEVQAAAQAAIAAASAGKATQPRASSQRNGTSPRPRQTHEHKAIHGTRQLMATKRTKRRNQGGVLHLERAAWQLGDADRQILAEIQRGGKS